MPFSKGQKFTAEHRRNLSKARKGKKHSEETMHKISESTKRKHASGETVPWNKGRPRSEQTKKKISKTLIGHKHSNETKTKMSKSHIDLKHSEEHRRRISEGLIGHKHSEETKAKIGEVNCVKVCYVGQLEKWPEAPDHLGIWQGAEDMGWSPYFYSVEAEDPTAADQVNGLKPDLVIHGNTDSLGRQLCCQIRPDITQVFAMLDYRTPEMLAPGEWERWKTNAPYLSLITISARDHIPMWEKAFGIPTFFWPHGCWIPPKLKYDPEFDYDVLFIGGHHDLGPLAERTWLISRIEYLLKKEGIHLTQVNETDLEKRNQVWCDQPKYYHSSKIVLDISHFWNSDSYCSGRYWYTATLGACTVTKRFPGCEKFFPHMYKYYFNTAEHAVDLIVALLGVDADERENTKKKVAEHAWEHHNYRSRFTELLVMLKNIGVPV